MYGPFVGPEGGELDYLGIDLAEFGRQHRLLPHPVHSAPDRSTREIGRGRTLNIPGGLEVFLEGDSVCVQH